ncbi:hypothetical protein BC941DRAFT_431723 [Chlamydoabsidia padenii]|nr:hypothetical protein BC941DRAFT_431723 [Chlamydoabsidia padenii]
MLMKPTIVHLPKPKVNHSTKATVITSSPARPSLSTSSSTSSPMATTKTALLSPISSYTQYHGGSNAEQHQMQHSHTIESSKVTINRRHYLVSDTLYFEVPQSIQDNDIIKLLAPCRPITIQRNEYQDQYQNNIATGWIRFIDKEQGKLYIR